MPNSKRISQPPKNLDSEEKALWFEKDTGLTPRGALLRLSYERFQVGEEQAKVARLKQELEACAEYAPDDLQGLAEDALRELHNFG